MVYVTPGDLKGCCTSQVDGMDVALKCKCDSYSFVNLVYGLYALINFTAAPCSRFSVAYF